MDDKKQEDSNSVSTDTSSNAVPTTVDTANNTTETTTVSDSSAMQASNDAGDTSSTSEEGATTTNVASRFNLRAYVGAVVVILVIAVGLIFVLQKEGRISTGLFSGVISKMEANSPAAIVNDVEITMGEFNSIFQQLAQMGVSQGADTTDPAIVEQLRTQAIETLVNAELLRQAAIKEGMTASAEQIDTRFNEIQEGIGGAEELAARMTEFGVTEESLRRDIENEFLIQGLFGIKIATNTIEISESEISEVYENAGGATAGLPPISEVREQIVGQIRFEKEQALINEYLESLKADSKVEILI